MKRSGKKRMKSGSTVVLTKLPPGLIRGLPREDQEAISAIVGKPIVFVEYDKYGSAELRFTDAAGIIHFIYVDPSFIRAVKRRARRPAPRVRKTR
jgi:hypothetical protein